jgi:hypothetical protein
MSSSGINDAEKPREPWTRRYSLLLSLGVLVVLMLVMQPGLIVQVWRGGLRPCRNLDRRICKDLGPRACDVWVNQLGRTISGSSQSHEWRRNKTVVVDVAVHKLLGWDAAHQDNPLCYDQLDDAIYPKILGAIRQAVAARAPAP